MSKRKNDGEINEKSKQQKPNDDADPNEIVVPVGFQNEMQPSAIFKLNAICCDDLFDWLSLKDLHSLGQTCKRMQRLTGAYFQENFKGTLNCQYQSIYHDYIQLDGFIKFVQKMCIEEGLEEDFQYIGTNCHSLREIIFDGVSLTKSLIDFIKGKLNKIETIYLRWSDFNSINLYEDFLIFCTNLKTLILHSYELYEDEWMCYKYPKLTHLQLVKQTENLGRNIETFFQQNPQLQSFECDCDFLMDNSETIINSMMKLDLLKIDFDDFDDDVFDEMCPLLNKLYENGFYKRLEIKCYSWSQRDINLISKLSGLEKLDGRFEDNIVFPSINSLKELSIIIGFDTGEINSSAMIDAFPNLRIVCSEERKEINQFLPLIQQLPKLKELHLPRFNGRLDSNKFQIDLSKLNEERKKLSGACKLIIYVPENTYLETKMAPKNLYTNHDLIEIKIETHNWYLNYN